MKFLHIEHIYKFNYLNPMEQGNNNGNIYNILDTNFFIKCKALDLVNGNEYLTTQYIVNEIKDESAREYYELNKGFIKVKNPSKESIEIVSKFAEMSNDLGYLSIADISVIALAYEVIVSIGKGEMVRKEPTKYQVVDKDKLIKELKQKEKDKQQQQQQQQQLQHSDDDDEDNEDDWITPENIDTKLNNMITSSSNNNKQIQTQSQSESQSQTEKENKHPTPLINVFVHSADFTLQNVCMKMSIPIKGIDGMQIRKIKNYILKCTTCHDFIFDTSVKFCDFCGYPYLMKIGYNIYSNGDIKINDKKPNIRKRGTQYDLPKPSLAKNGTIYILADDQLPKQKHKEINVNKVLEYYENMQEMPKHMGNEEKGKSSKQFVWGYPKQNPNKAKKYYSKKKK